MAARKAKRSKRPARKRATPRRAAGARAAEFVVAALAHDIRTPLTGILALSELLSASELGERERRWVVALKSNAEHLAALTTLVVDAARIDARNLVVRRDPFDPRRLVQMAAASLSARAEAAGLACTIDIADDVPALALGDSTRLRAAMENLIDNAVKFTERGGVTLKVTTEPRARPRHAHLVFAITDSGIGLSAAEIRQLFRPFAQANADIARRFGGAGLGLALVKRLAQALGGGLSVTSKPGRGSTFRLAVALERPRPEAAADVPRAGDRGVMRALHVLYVEDNPYGRLVMQTILNGLGHQVEFAATGEAAIEAVRRGGFDLVLMDVSLAGIDGLEATRRIRALDTAAARVPIIGLSGHGDASAEAAARAAGMDAYLVKPVTPRALADAVAQIIARRPDTPGV